MGNREKAVSAAIELLGTEGIRSLTHGRVDERAGLPKGSTSNHFRTRAALLRGVLDAMLSSELPGVVALRSSSAAELVDSLVDFFEFLTGPNRLVTTARLALFLEAAHDEDLRASLAHGRATLEEHLGPALASLGAPDPALATQVLAAGFEGMFLHRIARHAEIEPRPLIERLVRAALT